MAKALKQIDPYSTYAQRWVHLWNAGNELTRALMDLWNKFGAKQFASECARVQDTLFAPYKTKAASGAPEKWSPEVLFYLWLAIEIEVRLVRSISKKPRLGIEPSLDKIFRANRKLAIPWRPELILDNANTARRLHARAKQKLKANAEAARLFNEIADLEVARRLTEIARK